jgi:hypothetical protein
VKINRGKLNPKGKSETEILKMLQPIYGKYCKVYILLCFMKAFDTGAKISAWWLSFLLKQNSKLTQDYGETLNLETSADVSSENRFAIIS